MSEKQCLSFELRPLGVLICPRRRSGGPGWHVGWGPSGQRLAAVPHRRPAAQREDVGLAAARGENARGILLVAEVRRKLPSAVLIGGLGKTGRGTFMSF